jgi:hypothetical protein
VKADHNEYIEYKTETNGEITQYYEVKGRRVVIPCLQLLGRDIHSEPFLRDDKNHLKQKQKTQTSLRYLSLHAARVPVASNNNFMKDKIKIKIKARSISN